jgi:hypothetical protein
MRNQPIRRSVAGISALALLALISIAPKAARAGVDADVRAGVTDGDQISVGGGVLTQVGSSSRWYFNPNVEVAMGDHKDVVAMSGDFHYDLAEGRGPAFWVGGGPALLVTDREFGDNETDLGLNVLTGVGKKQGQVRPFAQLRGTVADESQVTIAGGIRF